MTSSLDSLLATFIGQLDAVKATATMIRSHLATTTTITTAAAAADCVSPDAALSSAIEAAVLSLPDIIIDARNATAIGIPHDDDGDDGGDDDDDDEHKTLPSPSPATAMSVDGSVIVDSSTLPQLPPSRRASATRHLSNQGLDTDDATTTTTTATTTSVMSPRQQQQEAATVNHAVFFQRNTDLVRLNVGGRVFVTTATTLRMDPHSMFNGLLRDEFGGRDADDTYFIDRSPEHFQYVLNYLRDGRADVTDQEPHVLRAILSEARFYQVNGLAKEVAKCPAIRGASWRNDPSSEKVYKMVTVDSGGQVDSAQARAGRMTEVLRTMSMQEGYDYLNAIVQGDVTYMVFTKTLTKGELMLLDRLQTQM